MYHFQAQLVKMGTPNRFPKVLPAKKIEWERLQSMDLRTLSLCIHEATEKWNDTVSDLCDCVIMMHIADLLFKLRNVGRSILPGTDAEVILLPAACIMSECSLMSDADLLGHVNQRAKLFVEFFMHNIYGRTTLEEALRVYAEFHILEGQPVEWSQQHSFKCNCPHFYQWASCHHGTWTPVHHGVQASPSGASTIPRVGSSFEGQAWQSPPW